MNVILLSGGSGKRLWPLSNDVRSKQFIKLFKNNDEYESMVQRVYRQITTVDADAKITIATSKSQASAIKNQLGEKASICVEPCRRDTFPAIALAAAYLHDELGVAENEAVVVCPVDPYVDNTYYEAVKNLQELAEQGRANLTLMGIEPTYPSEKYGYIIPENGENVSKVKEFKEKPDVETAKKYLAQSALWNAGIFAFKLGYLLDKAHSMIDFEDYRDLFNKYDTLTKISFDYAVVEKESSIQVLRYSGDWKDVGTWNMMAEVMADKTKGKAVLDETCENTNVVNELNIPILCMFGFFVPLIAVEIYSQLDKIMLGAITTGSLENGYYEQARKITSIVVSIVTSLNTVLLSRVANLYINNQKEQIIDYYKRSVRFIYLLLFPMCVGMLVISQNFTAWFFGVDYGKVATLLDLSCPLLFFMCLGNFVGVQYLSPMGMQNKMTKAYLTAASVNFCLNLLLIPRLYSVGALIASIIAEAGSCFIQLYYFAKSEYAIPLWKPMWKYIVSALVMEVVLLGFNAILPVAGVLQTVADIVVGGIVYAACLILLREELVCMVLKTVKAKQKNRSFIK